MESTECSICFEHLAKTTGSSTMACGHCFHIGCLARWLTKNETCPYCRHEANEHEKFQELGDDESEDEYDTDNESDDEDERGEDWIRVARGRWITVVQRDSQMQNLNIPEYDAEAHALWVFRKTMELVESGEEIHVQKEVPKPDTQIVLPTLREGYYDHLAYPHDGYETS